MAWLFYPRPLTLRESLQSLLNLAEARTRMAHGGIWTFYRYLWTEAEDRIHEMDRTQLRHFITLLLPIAEATKEGRFRRENNERIRRIRQTLRKDRIRKLYGRWTPA